ncbi:DUF2905 domain-containing protein [Acidocella sp.]|uniref:DUF2905 domain-containing protein n=1 Tax=Acidocella sp. TaxID=50710 RepID=UPI00262459C3|nr:DUF2905 domain-containing protein [Acidocella sp.]
MRLFIIVLGALLLAAGLLWPWFGRFGLGHLPGDISIRGERFSFYFPITTCVVVSVVLSFVVWLLNR